MVVFTSSPLQTKREGQVALWWRGVAESRKDAYIFAADELQITRRQLEIIEGSSRSSLAPCPRTLSKNASSRFSYSTQRVSQRSKRSRSVDK